MNKNFVSKSFSVAIFLLAVLFATSIQLGEARTTLPACPVGYVCTPTPVQPANCPVGYTCTPISSPNVPIYTPVAPSVPPRDNPPCFSFTTNLSASNSGSEVVELQKQLIAKGFDIPAISSGLVSKGYFGSQTVEALKRYQRSKGVTTTGILDLSTRQEINSSIGCIVPPSQPVASPPITVTVHSPNGGESWQKGTTQKIRWSDNTPYNSGVKIYDIFLEGTPTCTSEVCTMQYRVQTIARGVTTGSYYNWRIEDITGGSNANSYSPGSYKIRICESGLNICDSSDSNFKITSN